MIDEADAEQLATFAQPLRDVDVFGTWFWASTRMIVGVKIASALSTTGT